MTWEYITLVHALPESHFSLPLASVCGSCRSCGTKGKEMRTAKEYTSRWLYISHFLISLLFLHCFLLLLLLFSFPVLPAGSAFTSFVVDGTSNRADNSKESGTLV